MAKIALRHDAHVRARRALARRVLDRRAEWGLIGQTVARAALKLIGWDRLDAALMAAAYDAISAHQWRAGWGEKLSRYSLFGAKQTVTGTYRDVPVETIHSLMCAMSAYIPTRVEAERQAILREAGVGER
jgi:hypothetical protein